MTGSSDSNNAASSAVAILDTVGLMCPEPIMLLHKLVREVTDGDEIRVIATDPATKRDVPHFCQFLGHELLSSSHEENAEGELFVYQIKVHKPL
jgi:tRNA 2-thiouridine synthesizing protein A